MDYEHEASVFKALGEPTRLRILDVLSCGELCACRILEALSISQPTLSHHMKVLLECGLVTSRKDATWIYYTINKPRVDEIHLLINVLTEPKPDCVCNTTDLTCES